MSTPRFWSRDAVRVQADLKSLVWDGMTVLEVGCGEGYLSTNLACLATAKFYLVEPDHVALVEALRRLLHMGRTVVTCQCTLGQFLQYSGSRENIDLVVISSVLQYIQGWNEQLQQLMDRCSQADFYLTNHFGWQTPLNRAIERTLAQLDWRWVRWRKGLPRAHAPSPVFWPSLSPDYFNILFKSQGFTVHTYRYTTLLTDWGNRVHRLLQRLRPSLGRSFTVIARRPSRG